MNRDYVGDDKYHVGQEGNIIILPWCKFLSRESINFVGKGFYFPLPEIEFNSYYSNFYHLLLILISLSFVSVNLCRKNFNGYSC